ncbi:uncharacterized protein LOC107269280 [Cephus cinctus]|uniref:Uncharacterized protein LOC107269280 n=1 Tax=Cephus cinctus TaxID=211228 RepID=A0AAJ7C0Q2_CEPCN|nr:uncharacterized protein LOC107269280 [Cephus cinctus]
MNRSSFTIVVDLTKYFTDARACSRVFVDETKVWYINHLKQHIINLFGIEEPFHLLINKIEYLPPTEDIRIINGNDVVIVVPGSGLCSGTVTVPNPVSITVPERKALKDVNTSNKMLDNGNFQTRRVSDVDLFKSVQESDTSSTTRKFSLSAYKSFNTSTPAAPGRDTTMFHTVIDDTELESATESKATDSNGDFIVSEGTPMANKRKRIRHRRTKRQTPIPLQPFEPKENGLKKPRTNNSTIISSGKHIRFDIHELQPDHSVTTVIDLISPNPSKDLPSQSSNTKDLSTLLALGKSSTPVTFSSKKVVSEPKKETMSKELEKSNNTPDKTNEAKHNSTNGKTTMTEDYSELDPQKYAIITDKPQKNDIVAFKVLKMGVDYTPQVSEFIIAEIVEYVQETSSYTFKVIRGKEHLELPDGKFTLPEEENKILEDTVTLAYDQLIEPRLITSK